MIDVYPMKRGCEALQSCPYPFYGVSRHGCSLTIVFEQGQQVNITDIDLLCEIQTLGCVTACLLWLVIGLGL